MNNGEELDTYLRLFVYISDSAFEPNIDCRHVI
jgi:hypothetical protein